MLFAIVEGKALEIGPIEDEDSIYTLKKKVGMRLQLSSALLIAMYGSESMREDRKIKTLKQVQKNLYINVYVRQSPHAYEFWPSLGKDKSVLQQSVVSGSREREGFYVYGTSKAIYFGWVQKGGPFNGLLLVFRLSMMSSSRCLELIFPRAKSKSCILEKGHVRLVEFSSRSEDFLKSAPYHWCYKTTEQEKKEKEFFEFATQLREMLSNPLLNGKGNHWLISPEYGGLIREAAPETSEAHWIAVDEDYCDFRDAEYVQKEACLKELRWSPKTHQNFPKQARMEVFSFYCCVVLSKMNLSKDVVYLICDKIAKQQCL